MKHANQVTKSLENAKSIIEMVSFAADGPHDIKDKLDAICRSALDELARAQEAFDKLCEANTIKAVA